MSILNLGQGAAGRRMRRADCSNKSSQSLPDATSVFLGSSSLLATGVEWPALFPGKEDIYDLDYPELQELQKKLVHYLHKTTPTCPHQTSATGLLRLVKLEIQERQSCAFMLENILSMQNTCNSKDEGNTRVQNSADASAPATPLLTTAPGAGVPKAAAQEGNASLDVNPSLTLPETNALTTLCTMGPTVPPTFTYSDSKATYPPMPPPFRKRLSSPVSSTMWSTGNITCFPSAEVSLDPESSKILNRSASIASNVFKPDHAPPPHNSAQPRSRASNFAALAKKLFGEASPPVPSFSVLPPPPEPPCDAKVPCASSLKVVKRSRRKTGGAKLSGHKRGTQDPQKKSMRRCSDKLPSDVKAHATWSIERRPSKEKPVTRETTRRRTAPLHRDSAAPCVSLADTQNPTARVNPQVAEANAAPQEEKQKQLHGKKDVHRVARSLLTMPLQEQPNTEASNGSRDPIGGLCIISKADTYEEGKAKPLGSLNKSVNPSLFTKQKESAGCATATSLLDSTSSASVGDNNSDTRTTSCSTHRLLPLVEIVERNAHVTSSEHASSDVTFRLGKKSSSPPPPVNTVLSVQGKSEGAQNPPAIVTLTLVEAATVEADITSEEGAAETLSHVAPVGKQQETGHQRFLRRVSRRYTDDLHKKKVVEVEQDEGDGREKGSFVHCMGRTLLARDLLVRREEARCQRSGSTGATQKKVPVKQKKQGATSGSALTIAEDIDVIGSCVYQELAHISIRNSAKGVIGDIDSIIQAMSLKTAEQEQQSEATESESAAATTTPTALPAAPTEVTAGRKMPDENNLPCSVVRRCCTDEGRSEQGDIAKKVHSSDTISMSSDSDTPSVKQIVQNANETGGTVQFDGRGKQATDHLSDGSNASMEKVYALLAALNGQPSRESCANANEPLNRSGMSCSTAFGWRIQIGNEDDVDPVCQIITMKKTQEKEQAGNCLMVEEPNFSPSRGPKNSKNPEGDQMGGLCSFKQESRRWSSPIHRKRHLSLSLRKTDMSPEKEVTTTKGCGHNEDNNLLCKIQCQFPTLADLLTEGEKAKHAGTLRDILVNNGKCCADLCQLEAYRREHAQKMNCASECKSNHVITRFYKVEKNRPEVFSIVCRALKKEEGWEPVPEGQHWEYGWNLLWTWRPPRINYNKLLSFQKVNHFPEGRHLTRKDKLKSCIERYQKLAGKRSEIFNIIPKTYLMPKEHTALFNDMCEAEEQKRKSIWICKPKDGSRGRGIYLADSIGKIKCGENILVQDYIANPLLLNGRKFDLRLYVLVTSFNPLEAFVYKQGFARVARVPFSLDPEHLGNRFMHLTNASVQTKWQDPSESEDEVALKDVFEDDSPYGSFSRISSLENENERDFGHSRSVGGESSKLVLDELRIRLEQSGLDWDALWHRIILVILKSLSCCSDYIPFQPNSFELFGYDILIDAGGKPWLIEVNSSPCMSQDYDIDRRIKPSLIEDTIRLVNPVVYDRFKLSSIIAGRLSDAVSTDGQSAALVSPRRGYHSNNQATEGPACCSCSSSSLTSPPSSSSSYSSFRRGLLTHRPSRKATPDVKSGSEEWKKSQRRHVKRQYQQDLVALLNNTKPREYGELPAALGQYERIAPSKAWYQLQVLRQSLLGKPQRIDAGTT